MKLPPRIVELPAPIPAGPRPSPLARSACALYVLLVLAASWAPWGGWRDAGVDPFAFLAEPLARHWVPFDVAINVAGYLPLGALAVLALHPWLRGARAVGVATLAAALLSLLVESLQTLLPMRVASNLDLLANAAGALAGALATAPLAGVLIDDGRIAQWRTRWFTRDAAVGLVLVGAWPWLQVEPSAHLFGLGTVPRLARAASHALGLDAGEVPGADGLPELLPWPPFGPAEFVLAEAFVTVCGMLAAGLSLSAVLQPAAPRPLLIAALFAGALAAKGVAHGLRFGPAEALIWLTPGAIGGLLLGSLALTAAAGGRRRTRLALALLATGLLIAAVNALPANPYHLAWRQGWPPGRLAHLSAAVQAAGALWPYVLAGWLALRLRARLRRRAPRAPA